MPSATITLARQLARRTRRSKPYKRPTNENEKPVGLTQPPTIARPAGRPAFRGMEGLLNAESRPAAVVVPVAVAAPVPVHIPVPAPVPAAVNNA